MARVKVCPSCGCGYHNSSTANECIKCGADLFGVSPVVEEVWNKQQEMKLEEEKKALALPKVEKAPIAQKICPECKTPNSMVAKVCTSCGFVIKGIRSQSSVGTEDAKQETSKISLKLWFNGEQKLILLENSTPIVIVGREHFLSEYLAEKQHVSRRHAQLMLVNGILSIKDVGSLNGTFINSVKIAKDDLVELKHGDRVSLGCLWPKDPENSNEGLFVVDIS